MSEKSRDDVQSGELPESGGEGLATWKKFLDLWQDPVDPTDVIVTERAGHAREIAASTHDRDLFVAVGGDGTANEIMSGIMTRAEPRPRHGGQPFSH